MLYRTGVLEIMCPADHPKWPVACGVCGSRCLGTGAVWQRWDLRRAYGVTLYLCMPCLRWGMVELKSEREAVDAETWKDRLSRIRSSWLFGAAFSHLEGRRLEPDDGTVEGSGR